MDFILVILLAVVAIFLVKFTPSLVRDFLRNTELKSYAASLERVALKYINDGYSPAMAEELKQTVDCEDFSGGVEEKISFLHSLVFYAACRKCMKNHAKVLLRKRRSSLYKDDYGLEMQDKWVREVAYFSKEVLVPFLEQESLSHPELMLEDTIYYESHVDNYGQHSIEFYTEVIDKALEEFFKLEEYVHEEVPSDGLEYEHYVASIIEKHGLNARVTKGSGDHGADIFVDLDDGETIVIQCKNYSSPVGNKAVQEVYSAKDIYGADQAWVVTSSRFTSSAKIAAQKLGVLLFHHEELPEVLEAIVS